MYKVLALVLVALWLPATSFCSCNRADLAPDGDCCPSGSQGTATEASTFPLPCCVLTSGMCTPHAASTAASLVLVRAPHIFVTLPDVDRVILRQERPGMAVFLLETRASWQFALRAALPSQAPPLAA